LAFVAVVRCGLVKRGVRSRLIVKLTLCTLAGAVVTWGVAWGCALWAPLGPMSQEPGFADDFALRRAAALGLSSGSDIAKPLLSRRVARGPGYLSEYFSLGTRGSTDRPGVHVFLAVIPRRAIEGRAGWPWAAFQSGMVLDPKLSIMDGIEAPAVLKPEESSGMRLLPTRMLPLGFALNTLLAAGVLLGVVEGVAFARRRVRRAKGRCVACGYDRGGFEGDAAACPECGMSGVTP
jgi:hypothetical protein